MTECTVDALSWSVFEALPHSLIQERRVALRSSEGVVLYVTGRRKSLSSAEDGLCAVVGGSLISRATAKALGLTLERHIPVGPNGSAPTSDGSVMVDNGADPWILVEGMWWRYDWTRNMTLQAAQGKLDSGDMRVLHRKENVDG